MNRLARARSAFGRLWNQPATAAASGRPRAGIVFVAVVAAVAVAEAVVRTDLERPVVTTAVTVALLPLLLWKSAYPLPVVVVLTVATSGYELAARLAGMPVEALVVTVVFLAVPYALFRHGSGRDRIVGGALLSAGVVVSAALGPDGVAGLVAGVAFVGVACLVGVVVRGRVEAREAELDAVRLREREALARDLHDTVAHRVSAIALNAQAAATLDDTPAAVLGALDTIESEARSVLDETRSLVGALRSPAEYAPVPGWDSLTALAEPGPPEVLVRVDSAVGGGGAPGDETARVPDVIATTAYRIAQEAVTNARRHARNATRVTVDTRRDGDRIVLTVADDGSAGAGRGTATVSGGFGLRGIAERAALVGGTCEAGPGRDGGWVVKATLPVRIGR